MTDEAKLRRLADESIEAGDLRMAIAIFSKLLEAKDEVDTRLRRGQLYEKVGDAAAAMADYDRVIRANPRSSIGYVYRGLLRKREGQLKEAEADLSKAIELCPDHQEVRLRRAEIRMTLGDAERALEDYRSVLLKNPFCGEAIEGFAKAYPKAGQVSAMKSREDRKMGNWWHLGLPREPHETERRLPTAGVLTLKLDPAAWPSGLTMKAAVELSFVHPATLARGKAGRKASDAPSAEADDSSDA